MNVLIITWFYPPWNETASRRPFSWAKYLASQGHNVTVLTPRKDKRLHPNLNAPEEPRPHLNVVETPLRFLRTPIGKGASWAAGSAGTVARLARHQDVIISTYMPWFVHVLGRVAKFANPTALWLADYRDLWHEYDFFTEGRPAKKMLLRWFEKAVVRTANLTTTVSPPLANRLAATHPHIPCETIYNGFPAQSLREPWPVNRLIERKQDQLPFRILYAGTVYPGYHDPEPVFQALASRAWSRPIKLIFLGHAAKTPLIHELRRKYNLAASVETPEEYLNHQQCSEFQRDVDLLLHLGWTNRKMDGVLSAKVFEYMASGSPILSVGADSTSAIGRLLTETGTGISVGVDQQILRGTLEVMALQGQFPEWYKPNRKAILVYTREEQAHHLEQLLSTRRGSRAAKVLT